MAERRGGDNQTEVVDKRLIRSGWVSRGRAPWEEPMQTTAETRGNPNTELNTKQPSPNKAKVSVNFHPTMILICFGGQRSYGLVPDLRDPQFVTEQAFMFF